MLPVGILQEKVEDLSNKNSEFSDCDVKSDNLLQSFASIAPFRVAWLDCFSFIHTVVLQLVGSVVVRHVEEKIVL